MKKFLLFLFLITFVAVLPSKADTVTVKADDMGLSTSDNLNELSPLSLNDDIQIVFEGGNTYAKYASAGYINVAPNTTMKIQGKSDDIKIEEIVFTVYKKSYRLSDASITPDGTLIYVEDDLQNVWTANEAANEVVFVLGFDNLRFNDVTVKYSKASAGGNTGSTESVEMTIKADDMGLSTSDNLNELSPISLNDDIQIVFEGGNTYAKYASAGYINVAPNTTMKIQGKSDDIKIEEIVFTVYKKSYRLSDASITPDGTLIYVEDDLQNVWTANEAANEVVFVLGFDNLRFNDVTVKYTKASAGGNTGTTQSVEMTVKADDMGLTTSDNLNELSPISLNDDIQIVFEGGNTYAKYASAGYINVAPNTTFKIQGKSDDIKIEEIVFTVYKKSYRLSDSSITPDGTLTYVEDDLQNVWTANEPANEVVIVLGFDNLRFNDITVKYTKPGSGDADDPGTSDEDKPKVFKFEVTDLNLKTTDNLHDLSPISLNEDVQVAFEGGNTNAKYASAGYINVAPNTTIKIQGKSDDVKVQEVIFHIKTKSYRMVDVTVRPDGELIWNEELLQNEWAGTPSNEVVFMLGFDNPHITAITVKYTGGKAVGGESPEEPEEPETPEEPEDNLLSTGFTTTAEFAQFTIINMQEGSNTWKHSTGNPYAKIENDLGNTIPKDDYLVSPALEMKAGKTYRLTFDTWCGAPDYPEIIAAYLLTTPDNVDDKSVIIPPTEITNDTNHKRELSGMFTVSADGQYYVAIHAASLPGMHYLYADNVEVSRGVSSTSPDQAADYKVTPSLLGENEVTVSFSAPALCFDGVTPLTDIKSYTVKRDGTLFSEITPADGETVFTVTDKVEKDGWYSYSVTVNAASGKSLDAKKTVYVGPARPDAPTGLKVEETQTGTVDLTWDAVTTNVYGFEIDPSIVTYNLYDGPYSLLQSGITENKLTLEYVKEGEAQKIPTFSVKAVTSKGESAEAAESAPIPVGPAHTMPYSETFAGSHITAGQPAEFISDEKLPLTYWRCFEEISDAGITPVQFDHGLMAFYANESGRTGIYRTGKILIDENASNPYLSFFYFSIPGADDHFTVGINDDVIEDIVIGGDERGWVEKLIPLDTYKGQTVRLTLTAYCVNPSNPIAVDDLSIKNEIDNDMAITRARIPYEMLIGADHACSVRVTNLGVNTSGDYTVNILAGDETVLSFEDTALERGKTKEFTFSLTPDLLPGQTVTYSVELLTSAEEKPEDNFTAIEVNIPDHCLPAPKNLAMEDSVLKWDAFEDADYPTREITESFESYDEFTINTAGEWSFFDGDNYPTFGMEDGYHSYPNMYEPMAFMVFNNHDGYFVGMGTMSFSMIDGGQCMASMAINCENRIEISNDDWMISPRLSGDAQTISFFARGTSLIFRETFSVLYTTSDNPLDVNSYRMLEKYEDVDSTWVEYTIELPAGATYFAIRNSSFNQYLFFVDKVSFTAAGKIVPVKGYDVYAAKSDSDDAEWTKLNDELLAEPQFEIESSADNKFVRVHALFENGVETVSAPCDIVLSGIGSVIYDADASGECQYYNLNGVALGGKPAIPGVYIVREGNTVRKVMINN